MDEELECIDCGEELKVGRDPVYLGSCGPQCTDCYFYDSTMAPEDDY